MCWARTRCTTPRICAGGCQLQESRLPDHLKVWEALDLFASLAPGAVDWPTLLEQWGLAEKRNAAFSSLSGGQRQRLFIALALVSWFLSVRVYRWG